MEENLAQLGQQQEEEMDIQEDRQQQHSQQAEVCNRIQSEVSPKQEGNGPLDFRAIELIIIYGHGTSAKYFWSSTEIDSLSKVPSLIHATSKFH